MTSTNQCVVVILGGIEPRAVLELLSPGSLLAEGV